MATKRINITSPLKGVNRLLGREQQPQDTAWDALNMVPEDRYGRMRLSQREGTAKLFASSLNSEQVKGIHQVTYIDPGGAATFYSDMFTYSNGNLTGNGNWAAVGGFTSWVVDANNLRGLTGVADFGNVQTTGMSGFDETDDFTVSCSFQFTNGASAHNKNLRIELQDATIVAAWYVDITETASGTADIELQGPDDDVVVTGVSITRNTDHTISFEFDASATTGTLLFNGTSIGSFTTASWGVALTRLFVAAINSGGLTSSGATIVNDITVTNGPSSDPERVNKILATTTDVWVGTTSGLTQIGTNLLTLQKPSICDLSSIAYVVDGTSTLAVDMVAETVGNLTASAGTIPVECRIARAWRGRLVLAAPDSNPQNFFFSRSGDATDFDYAQTDPAGAFAGNASENGRMGDIILDMIPWTSDLMLVMGDHSIYLIEGDPKDNGSLVLLSNGVGIIGRDAWTIAPDGSVYFVATSGFCRISPGSRTVENLSDTSYPQFFRALDRATMYFGMQWDRDKQGCFLFFTLIATGTSSHLFYDDRLKGFWPLEFPDDHGPLSSIVYDGNGPDDRFLIMGGRDGYLYYTFPGARTDDGDTISAYMVTGPYQPFEDAGKLVGVTLNFGELAASDVANPERWGVNAVLASGGTAYDVTEGTARVTATVDCPIDRRQKTIRQRLRGGWFTLKFETNAAANYFYFESGVLEFEPAGKNRDQR